MLDEDDLSLEGLLSDADSAMYFAKTYGGKGKIQVFDKAIRAMARERTTTESDLGYALEHGELGRLLPAGRRDRERARHRRRGTPALEPPDRGLLLPAAFLDLAEQTGLIVPIGEWVLAQACRQVQSWNDDRGPHDQLALSVNLSARQLAESDLSSSQGDRRPRRSHAQARSGCRSRSPRRCCPSTRGLRRPAWPASMTLGIQLAIDDFGTGYASLSYVMDLPITIVKIDQSFVARIGRDPRGEAVVHAVVQLAHTLGLQIIAEGVETEAQLDFLSAASCDYSQGYLFSRPQPATEAGPPRHLVAQLLTRRRRRSRSFVQCTRGRQNRGWLRPTSSSSTSGPATETLSSLLGRESEPRSHRRAAAGDRPAGRRAHYLSIQ